jgi:uncharacterized membrane protein
MRPFKLLFSILSLFSIDTFAQQEIEMADAMRSEGKIYVVVAIIAVILIGILGYLILIDRKVSRLENRDFKKD